MRIKGSYADMMASSNGNVVRVTGPLWGESTGHRWILLTKASDADLWCFLWSAPEQTVQQTIEAPAIWDAITVMSRTSTKLKKSNRKACHELLLTYKTSCKSVYSRVKIVLLGAILFLILDNSTFCSTVCLRSTSKKTSKLRVTDPLCESTIERTSNAKTFSRHDVFMVVNRLWTEAWQPYLNSCGHIWHTLCDIW